jgi:hypothetical protein
MVVKSGSTTPTNYEGVIEPLHPSSFLTIYIFIATFFFFFFITEEPKTIIILLYFLYLEKKNIFIIDLHFLFTKSLRIHI